MNIYNNSQAQSESNYPPQITSTTIDTQDIIVRNGLQITGATKGDLLICEDNSNNIGGLQLGPNNYVLQADSASGLPIWRNFINVNEVQTVSLKIPGIVQGDLLVGQNTEFLGRLPCGANDTVLFSDGGQLGWLPRSAGNSYVGVPGPTAIPLNTASNIISIFGLDLSAGKRFKLTVSGNVDSSANTNFVLSLNGSQIAGFSYVFNADMHRTIIYTAPVSGAVSVVVSAFSNTINSNLNNFLIVAEQF